MRRRAGQLAPMGRATGAVALAKYEAAAGSDKRFYFYTCSLRRRLAGALRGHRGTKKLSRSAEGVA